MAELEWLLVFTPTQCNQCHGCVVACQSWRGTEPGVRLRRVLEVWLREAGEQRLRSLNLSCLHCLEPACAAACPMEALTKNPADGRVLVDQGLCTGCGACVQACVYGVPQIGASGRMDKCDLCADQLFTATPPCIDTCPGQALVLKQVDREEKRGYETWCRSMLHDAGSDGVVRF